MKKFFAKVKSLVKRGKTAVVAAVAAVSTAAVSVCASAATTEASNMEAMMKNAGDQLTNQFGSLVGTIIPVIIGILGSGLVIFGLMALIRLAKKTFGKVAG